VKPATLFTGSREHFPDGFPEPEGAVTDGQHRGGHAAAAAIPQKVSPRLGRLPVPVGEGNQLFAAIGTHPEHHQQAQFLLLQADLEVDAVDPQVDVVGTGEIPAGKGLGFVLPLAGEPGDRRCRKPGTGAQELL
jgi:hypothetical protein